MSARNAGTTGTTRAPATKSPQHASDEPKRGYSGIGHGGMLTSATFAGGRVLAEFGDVAINGEKVTHIDATLALEQTVAAVREGDLTDLEAMLTAQAVALQGVFVAMITRAKKVGTAESLGVLGGLALRAQAQSRATIDSIVNLKHPRQAAFFAKQLNVAADGGQQQVVNGAPASRAPAHEDFPRTELDAPQKALEDHGSTILDSGTALATGRNRATAETVAALDRPAQRGRKSSGRA